MTKQIILTDGRKLAYAEYGDKNVPLVMGKYFEKQIPKSRLVVYPNEGHLISITHAEEIFGELAKS